MMPPTAIVIRAAIEGNCGGADGVDLALDSVYDRYRTYLRAFEL